VVTFLCWNFAIKETLTKTKKYNTLIKQSGIYENQDSVLSVFRSKIESLQYSPLSYPDQMDDHLMDIISEEIPKYNIALEDFPDYHSFNSENYLILSYQITFSGRFTDMLRFIDFFEIEVPVCKIISSSFERKLIRGQGEKLFVKLYFQSIFKHEV
jgi:hypothetical protein